MFSWIVVYLMTALYEIASSFFPYCKLCWGAYQVLDQLEFLRNLFSSFNKTTLGGLPESPWLSYLVKYNDHTCIVLSNGVKELKENKSFDDFPI